MENVFIDSLQATVDRDWNTIKQGEFWKLVMGKTVTKALYYDLMMEIYHYTKHNSRNQAATSIVEAPDALLRFVYQHAAEELGHERMVIHDLESIELLKKDDLQRKPLPATEALIGYLYFVAFKYGAAARLGYSFWAENVYDQIGEALAKIRKDLSLADKNMTFFVAHAKIDEKHADQVADCINRFATTPAEQAMVQQVARTTIFLTGQLLEQVAALHLK
ncbi:MAG TPA: iron-containing redox enzyme family protein [Burkholderiaceae bacterium]|jgi:thiaminase|nr:iron-containing redox enzyme family protein [Burkholderiaceae bacterium]